MKQEFTKLEDGKIKWEYTKDDTDFEDQEFGKVGTKGGYDYIIFDSKEQAKSILDRDLANVDQAIEYYEKELEKNEHNLDKFTDLKDLVEAVGKLHNDFKEIKNIPEKLYADNPKKYKNLLREFNESKKYISDEMSEINKEYGKFLNYGPAKKSYDFNVEQREKILEQVEKLNKV